MKLWTLSRAKKLLGFTYNKWHHIGTTVVSVHLFFFSFLVHGSSTRSLKNVMGNRRVLSRRCNNMHLKMALIQVPRLSIRFNGMHRTRQKKKLFIHWQSEKHKIKILLRSYYYYTIAKPHQRGKKERNFVLNGCGKVWYQWNWSTISVHFLWWWGDNR